MTTAQNVLDIARAEIGYVESGGSDGRSGNITKYWAEIAPSLQGEPWCAGFMDWCFKHAGLPFPFLYTYVPTLIDYAKQHGMQVFDPQPGDVALYWHGEHTGIVESSDGNGAFTAIEGNTSPTTAGSQSNGGGVYRKPRNISDCPDGFYRPPYTPSQEDDMFSDDDRTGLHIAKDDAHVAREEAAKANQKAQEIGAAIVDIEAMLARLITKTGA